MEEVVDRSVEIRITEVDSLEVLVDSVADVNVREVFEGPEVVVGEVVPIEDEAESIIPVVTTGIVTSLVLANLVVLDEVAESEVVVLVVTVVTVKLGGVVE